MLNVSRKIANRLQLLFLLVTLVPLTVVLIIILTVTMRQQQDRVIANLAADATFYAKNLQAFIADKQHGLERLSHNPFIVSSLVSAIPAFEKYGLNAAAYRNEVSSVDSYFANVLDDKGFYDLFYISPAGDVAYSFKKESDLGTNLNDGPFRNSGLAEVVERARLSRNIEFFDYSFYPPSDSYAAFFAQAVFSDDGYLGTLATQLNDKHLHAVLADYSRFGESGEIVLGKGFNDSVLFLAPLRHAAGAAFSKQEELGSALALPMQQAVRGVNGAGLSVDYRGKEVVAAWRHLPNVNWGMVVKIDSEEAFATIRETGALILLVSTVAGIFVMLVSLLTARKFLQPLQKLRGVTERMSAGDLSARVSIAGNDEFAELGRSFNVMAEQLDLQTAKKVRDLWLRQGLAALDDDLRGQTSAADTAMSGILRMACQIDAPAAVFYALEADTLVLAASTAKHIKLEDHSSFRLGEGLVGQVAVDRQSLQVDTLPDGYFRIRSGIGRSAPRHLYLLPVEYDQKLEGVAEFGLFADLSEPAREYLQLAAKTLAITLSLARSREALGKALTESQQLAEELQSSNEKLETQAKELVVSEEELQSQAEELRSALETLQGQQ